MPAAPGDAVPPQDPQDPRHDAALARVRDRLREAGATEAEIDEAVEAGVLDLLAVDRLLIPAPRRYTQAEVSEATGMPVDVLRRLWRALGFPDVADAEPAFTDLDIEAVRLFQGLVALGAADVDTAVQMARVIGSSMARIADAQVQPDSVGPVTGADDNVQAAEEFVSVADATLPAMARLLEFVWRRHVQAATRRTMMSRSSGLTDGSSPELAVGFADMVGFTLLSQHLTEMELAAVVRRFEELAHDIVTGLGGRAVKMIGDEVMFVVEDVVAAARIGLGLAEAYADDDLLSDVRVGLALGPVLPRDGDYFGPTVNLAHRIVNIAIPGAVLMSDDFNTALAAAAGDEFVGHPLRPRRLKDLGRVQLWRCTRVRATTPDTDHDREAGAQADEDNRRSLRWERLAEILPDLDELRDVGERAMAARRRRQVPSGAGQPDGGDAVGT